MLAPTPKRPSVLFGLWCLTTVFASATADAETDGKCHRRQARRARQEPDALRFEREIRVFPALAQAYTKNHQRPNADAGVRRVCGIYGVQRQRNGINHTVSPCPPAEDLKDFLSSKKTFKSGEEKAGSIDNIGNADTLPSEGFLEAGDLLDCLKKDWRRPAR